MGSVNHDSVVGALISVVQQLMDAVKSPKWMVACWKVEDGKVHLVGRTTWDFPTGDFANAAEMLNSHLKDSAPESKAPEKPEPLELAAFVRGKFSDMVEEGPDIAISELTLGEDNEKTDKDCSVESPESDVEDNKEVP